MIPKRVSLALLTNLFSEIIGKIAPILMLSLAQKRLGLEAFGMGQVAISLIEFAIPFVAFGYGQYGSIAFRQMIRGSKEEGGFVADICVLRVMHAVIATLALLVFTYVTPSYGIYFSSVLPLCSILFLSAIELLWVQVATQKLIVFGLVSFFSKIVTLLLTFFLVLLPDDAFMFSFLSLASSGLICLWTFYYCFSSISWQKPSFSRMKRLFWEAKSFSLIAIYVVFIDRIDLFVAQSLLGLEKAGSYSAILRINSTMIQLISVLGMVFLSETMLCNNKKDLTKWINLSIHGFLFLLVPLLIGSFFTDVQIARFIYGQDFEPPKGLLSIFLFGDVGNVLTIVFGQQILQLHKQARPVLISMILATVLFIFGCVIFKSQMNLTLIATLQGFSKLLGASVLVFYSLSYIEKLFYKDMFRPLLPGLFMGGCLFFMPEECSLFLKIGLGGVCYMVSYLLFNQKWLRLNAKNLTNKNP